MATNSADALMRAAHRARRDADQHLAESDVEAAAALFEALREADRVLRCATARLRQSVRPLSVTGHGETFDRLRDTVDDLALAAERERPELEDEDELDEQDDDETWTSFLNEHPELEGGDS